MECHPYFTQPKLLEYCRQHDIAIVGYSPLGTSRDESWYVAELLGDHPNCLVSETFTVLLAKFDHHNHPCRVNLKCPPLLEDKLLLSIAKKHNKTTAQVALRFNVQRGVAVIPKSFNPVRIHENFQVSLFARIPLIKSNVICQANFSD